MSVPSDNPRYEMLEVKLASYIDFPSRIRNGGVFVCCSDTFEAYNDENIGWKFAESGRKMNPYRIREGFLFIMWSLTICTKYV